MSRINSPDQDVEDFPSMPNNYASKQENLVSSPEENVQNEENEENVENEEIFAVGRNFKNKKSKRPSRISKHEVQQEDDITNEEVSKRLDTKH